ncbi:ABC transporter substrate-binding protein [Agarivorans sp. MS3-6]|uniref:ABC transporter substrate-binding protein n=1 Tax=Agarivorans sp. TSD2052 TaxID=2937286 RepID=UPI0020103661|nr:hypothetical protein [Agarivorans sp. TSD2052]UPW16774.1 hypothetical protein M0C34_10990 [Agarivorans sp. TSD2052]
MKKLLLSIVMFSFLVATIAITLIEGSSRPRLLILHSYNTDYSWTRTVNQGIERAKTAHLNVDIRYHYMNTKNQSSEAAKKRAATVAKRVVDSFQPDVMIVIDDDAQRLVAAEYIDKPDIQIVFAGVNAELETYGYQHASNVTGILERKSVSAVKEVLRLLVEAQPIPGQLAGKIIYLSDNSSSAKHDGNYLAKQVWSPIDYQGHVVVNSFTEWQQAVLSLEGNYKYLMVGGYRKLLGGEDGKFVSAQTVAQWTEQHSTLPIIGINAFNSEDGMMLSVGASPFEQGEVAFNFALELLNEPKHLAELPITVSKQYVVALRRKALLKREIVVPKVLEAFARATNNYYE